MTNKIHADSFWSCWEFISSCVDGSFHLILVFVLSWFISFLQCFVQEHTTLTWLNILPPFAFLVHSVFLLSLQKKHYVCLYLEPVLNPPRQHPEDPAKPLLCLRLRQTVEIEVLFSDVRSSASACRISTGNSLPWQGLALVFAHVAQWLQCHTAPVCRRGLTVEGSSQIISTNHGATIRTGATHWGHRGHVFSVVWGNLGV